MSWSNDDKRSKPTLRDGAWKHGCNISDPKTDGHRNDGEGADAQSSDADGGDQRIGI